MTVSRPIAVWLAVAVAGLTAAVSIRFHTFVASGTDQAAYIEAAHRWAAGRVAKPSPLQFSPVWSPPEFAAAPFGFRPGTARGTDVGEYPLGLPVLMAAAIRLGGPLAAYLVAPMFAGILVWSASLVGSGLAGSWAGLLTAGLLAASPITLAFAVQPMSDVPAAASWTLAWAMSLRPGLGASAAAGAAVAAAIMIRPNLAPLVAVILGLLWTQREIGDEVPASYPWRRIALCACVAAIGPAMVAWSHYELYGSPFRPGYLGAADFYHLANIQLNLTTYPRLLMLVHTPLIFAGLIASTSLRWPRVRQRLNRRARAVALSAVTFVVLNYLLYLPYLPVSDPGFLRFVFPAFVALCVLLAGLLAHVARLSTSRALATVSVVPAVVVMLYPTGTVRFALEIHTHSARVRSAGHYLREVLPANAVVITSAQGTSIAHYTGRLIVRLDAIPPDGFDSLVDNLGRYGYRPVLVLDGEGERAFFQAHFPSSRVRALDWPPRAAFVDIFRLVYLDPADYDACRSGQRWPTDVIRAR